MLYVFSAPDRVAEIVMPRVRRNGNPATPNGGAPGTHADGDSARRHWTGILYRKSGKWYPFENLDGDVLIEELGTITPNPGGGGCAADGVLQTYLPKLDLLANDPSHPAKHLKRLTSADGASIYWDRVAARIPLTSGTMSGVQSNDAFKFPTGCSYAPQYERYTQFVLYGRWTPSTQGNAVRIRCAREKGTPLDETFASGDIVHFYTADSSTPSETQLENQCPPGPDVIVDVDFKWIYQVLKAPGDDIKTWIKGSKCKKKLLAPYLDPADFAAVMTAPDVSTCYPAGWTGD